MLLKRTSLNPRCCFGRVRHERHPKQTWRDLVTLSIETSCDDTAVAILQKETSPESGRVHLDRNGRGVSENNSNLSGSAKLLFNEKITTPNTGLGGIHPLEALGNHQSNLAKLVDKATKCLTAPVDFVSVTRGPGMRANLNCGLDLAKGLAVAWQVPLLGVHHMQAHALTPRLVHAMNDETAADLKPTFPFLTLLVSGGHTMLLHSKGLVDHQIIATTRDIAIGDALDKCGRIILPDEIKNQAKDTAFARYMSDYAFPHSASYDSWPVSKTRAEEINKPLNKYGWDMQVPLAQTKDMAFSYSGVATRIQALYDMRQQQLDGGIPHSERVLFAQTALGIAFEHLASRTLMALEDLKIAGEVVGTLVVSGGVAANPFLRHFLRRILNIRGFSDVELLFPPAWLCTDNAAMIAWCGMEMYEAGYRSQLDIGTLKTWSMDSRSETGILGVPGWYRVAELASSLE